MRTSAVRASSGWLPVLVVPVAAAAGFYGGVYPWVYWPLLGTCTVIGVAALLNAGLSASTARTVERLAFAFAGILIAFGLQLVPVSRPILRTLSPATHEYLTRVDLRYVQGAHGTSAGLDSGRHALTVNPPRTLLACAFFAALAMYLLGALGILSRAAAVVPLAAAMSVLGVVVALTGLLLPPPGGAPAGFAPFVNRNHFSGWMSMTASLALGAFAARLSSLRGRGLSGRRLLVHIGSADGAKLILAAFAPVVMLASVFWSQSRSGALACVAGLLVMGAFATGRGKPHRSYPAPAALAGILIVAALWAGPAPLLARLEAGVGPDLATRVRAWQDALHVARAFPLAGTGLNTYGDVMLLYQTADPHTHYSAAHNDYLQIAAEGGVLLSVPILVALFVFAREARARLRADDPASRTYWIRRGAVAAVAAIAVQSLFDFSLQIPANALLFVLMCAIALHERRREQESVPHPPTHRVRLRVVPPRSR